MSGDYWGEFWGLVRERSGNTVTKVWAVLGVLLNVGVLFAGWKWLGLDLRSLIIAQLALSVLSACVIWLAFTAFRDVARQRDLLHESSAPNLTFEGDSPADQVVSGPGQSPIQARFTRAAFRNQPRPGGVGRPTKNLTARVTFYEKDGTFCGVLKNARFAETDERLSYSDGKWLVKPMTAVWNFDVPPGSPATLDLVCRHLTDGGVFPWSNDGKGPPLKIGTSYFVVAELNAEGSRQQVEYFLMDVPEQHDILLHYLSERPKVLDS